MARQWKKGYIEFDNQRHFVFFQARKTGREKYFYVKLSYKPLLGATDLGRRVANFINLSPDYTMKKHFYMGKNIAVPAELFNMAAPRMDGALREVNAPARVAPLPVELVLDKAPGTVGEAGELQKRAGGAVSKAFDISSTLRGIANSDQYRARRPTIDLADRAERLAEEIAAWFSVKI